jgi:protein involved in ribonucleotide reduction
MFLAYASMTGNVKRFIEKLDFPNKKIEKDSFLCVNKPFVIVTYTTGFGDIPKEVEQFLRYDYNWRYLKGVVGSGNRNWGDSFCGGAEKIASQYKVPLLHKFELSGFDSDVNIVSHKIRELEGMIKFGKMD